MRVGDVQHEAERQRAERETREAKVRSVPFVMMEADEFLCVDIRPYFNYQLHCKHFSKTPFSMSMYHYKFSVCPRYDGGHAFLARDARRSGRR